MQWLIIYLKRNVRLYYQYILGSISSREIAWFSLRTNLFCSRKVLWMFPQTILSCKLSRIVWVIQSYDSFLHPRPKPSRNLQETLKRLITISRVAKNKIIPDSATQKMMAVTPSKQWIHFLRSERWPPTSKSLKAIGFGLELFEFAMSWRETYLKCNCLQLKWVSMMPVVFTLVRNTSCCVGI